MKVDSRQTNNQTNKQNHTHKQMNKLANKNKQNQHRKKERKKERNKQTNKQASEQTSKQTNKQASKQANKQTSKKKQKQARKGKKHITSQLTRLQPFQPVGRESMRWPSMASNLKAKRQVIRIGRHGDVEVRNVAGVLLLAPRAQSRKGTNANYPLKTTGN